MYGQASESRRLSNIGDSGMNTSKQVDESAWLLDADGKKGSFHGPSEPHQGANESLVMMQMRPDGYLPLSNYSPREEAREVGNSIAICEDSPGAPRSMEVAGC